jgi:hypothetical protein
LVIPCQRRPPGWQPEAASGHLQERPPGLLPGGQSKPLTI